jgi:hypothetical protein
LLVFVGDACNTEALILTHELTKEEDMDAYLPTQLAPLRPVICFGRSAAAPPAVPKRHAVWHWWKD